jgi:hypothetical protein
MHRAGIGRRLDQGPERNSRCGATRGSSERVIERADLAQILVSHEEQRSDAPQYVCAGAEAKVACTHRGLEFARMETETFRKTREVGASRIFRILIVVCAAFVLGRVAWLMRQPTPDPGSTICWPPDSGDRRGRTGERLESWDSSSTSSPAPIAFQPDYAAPVRNLR